MNELTASVGTGSRFILTSGFYSCHPLVLVTSITAVTYSVIHPMNIFDMFDKFVFHKILFMDTLRRELAAH